MRDAEDFDAFVAIVDAGSISEAARELGTPRASLSRQLARLEERLGQRLLHRNTRRMVPTPAGETLYARARGLVDAARAAVDAVRRLDDTPRGPLRVSAPPTHTPGVGTLVAKFIERYPEVKLELVTTTRHVDLAAEQVDVALRAGVVREPSLIARRLLRTDALAVASATYLEQHGPIADVSELSNHPCLRGFEGGTRPAKSWPHLDGGTVPVDGPLVSNDIMALLGAALAGAGIAMLPRQLVQPYLDAGRLVQVLEGELGVHVSIAAVWVERQFLDPKVKAFVDFVTEWVEEGFWDTWRNSDFVPPCDRDSV